MHKNNCSAVALYTHPKNEFLMFYFIANFRFVGISLSSFELVNILFTTIAKLVLGFWVNRYESKDVQIKLNLR